MTSLLPPLEMKCPDCSGSGKFNDSELKDGEDDCCKCNGSGFVPTPDGKQILELLKHQSRVVINAQLCLGAA